MRLVGWKELGPTLEIKHFEFKQPKLDKSPSMILLAEMESQEAGRQKQIQTFLLSAFRKDNNNKSSKERRTNMKGTSLILY